MQYYNVHTHIFTMNNAPKRLLELYMPPIAAKAINTITSSELGVKLIAGFLDAFGRDGWKRYASFLRIGKSKNQLEVFESLIGQYSDKTMKFAALTLYMEALGAGSSTSGFEGQIEQILTVKERYADRLLVFLCVDPRWLGGGAALQQKVAEYFNYTIEVTAGNKVKAFTGIKLYPSTGFYPFDERLKATFEWAAENSIPVLSHCNYMGGIYNNDKSYVQGNLEAFDPYTNSVYKPNNPTDKLGNQEACSWFLEPESYKSMLRYFSGFSGAWQGKPLKLCLAHFGGDKHIIEDGTGKTAKSYHGNNPTNWCKQIKDLMIEFPSVYTDISYSLWNPKTHPFIFADLAVPSFSERILFGTDFFMTERELAEKDTYDRFKKKAIDVTDQITRFTAWDIIASRNTQKFLFQ